MTTPCKVQNLQGVSIKCELYLKGSFFSLIIKLADAILKSIGGKMLMEKEILQTYTKEICPGVYLERYYTDTTKV